MALPLRGEGPAAQTGSRTACRCGQRRTSPTLRSSHWLLKTNQLEANPRVTMSRHVKHAFGKARRKELAAKLAAKLEAFKGK